MRRMSASLVVAARHPRSQLFWCVTVSLVAVAKVVAVLALLGGNALFPDEQLYARILEGLAAGNSVAAVGFEIKYGTPIILSSSVLVLPSIVLVDLGLPSVAALRMTSIGLWTLAGYIFVLTVGYARKSQDRSHLQGPSATSAYALLSRSGVATLIFLLLPSQIVWTSLALRESVSILGCLMAVMGVTMALNSQLIPIRILGAGLTTIGLLVVYVTREQMSVILGVSIAIGALVTLRRKRSWWAPALVAVVSTTVLMAPQAQLLLESSVGTNSGAISTGAPIAGGPLAYNDLDTVHSGDTPAKTHGSNPSGAAGTNEGSSVSTPTVTESPNGGPLISAPAATESNNSLSFVAGLSSLIPNFASQREALRRSADSAYPSNYCESVTGLGPLAACELANLPIGVSRFVGYPLFTGDAPPAKPFVLFTQVENWAWVALVLIVILTLAMTQSRSAGLTAIASVFLVLGVVAFALTSGNAGTAFRHKSQFLWALCMVLALSGSARVWIRSLPLSRRHGKLFVLRPASVESKVVGPRGKQSSI